MLEAKESKSCSNVIGTRSSENNLLLCFLVNIQYKNLLYIVINLIICLLVIFSPEKIAPVN